MQREYKLTFWNALILEIEELTNKLAITMSDITCDWRETDVQWEHLTSQISIHEKIQILSESIYDAHFEYTIDQNLARSTQQNIIYVIVFVYSVLEEIA